MLRNVTGLSIHPASDEDLRAFCSTNASALEAASAPDCQVVRQININPRILRPHQAWIFLSITKASVGMQDGCLAPQLCMPAKHTIGSVVTAAWLACSMLAHQGSPTGRRRTSCGRRRAKLASSSCQGKQLHDFSHANRAHTVCVRAYMTMFPAVDRRCCALCQRRTAGESHSFTVETLQLGFSAACM